MTEPKLDRRKRYTKMVLRQSLLELMGDRAISRITVKDVCDRADINRSTFYAHYADTYDLLSHIQDEFLDSLVQSLRRYDAWQSTLPLVLEIVTAISENRDLCRVLFSDYGDHAFIQRVMYIAHDASIEAWRRLTPPLTPAQLEYAYAFIANGSVGIIQTWIHGGLPEPPEEIASLIESLAYNGIRKYIM